MIGVVSMSSLLIMLKSVLNKIEMVALNLKLNHHNKIEMLIPILFRAR